MNTAKNDFVYDVNDKLLLQSSLTNLQANEKSAFWWGIAIGLATTTSLKRFTRMQPFSRKVAGLFGCTTSYSFLTYQTRNDYGRLAARINKNNSEQINRILKY